MHSTKSLDHADSSRTTGRPRRSVAFVGFVVALATAPLASAQDVQSLACIPATIAGGSGASSTCTVTLQAPAPAGGRAVALTSTNTALAASPRNVTVAAGQSAANFTVWTNPDYRRNSGLAFDATISATTSTTGNAMLHVTAQPRPGPFDSGVQPGQRFQWQGVACGGTIGPFFGGDSGVLYTCTPATQTADGQCSFKQECLKGCRRVPPDGVVFHDACSKSGPNPVSLSQAFVVGGDHVPSTIVSDTAAAPGGFQSGAPNVSTTQGRPGAIDGINVDASFFPHDGGIPFPVGATSVPFSLDTSYVPQVTWANVVGFWSNQGSIVVTNGAAGQAWLAMAPTDPPPALPVPTLDDFLITGSNPVTGGQSTFGNLDVSGISSGGGPVIQFTSSHPDIVPAPPPFTMPAQLVLGAQVFFTTTNPPVDTDVTLTASDGRYEYSQVLKVTHYDAPLLQSVSVSPSTVVGGQGATGTVTLSALAPAGGVSVALSDPFAEQVAQLPTSVTVAEGTTSATFPITTTQQSETFNVNIYADLQGTEVQTLLIVTPPGRARKSVH